MTAPALRDIDLDIERGEVVALRGPSGSGKSTLLNILGCLDRPSSGTLYFGGQDVSRLGREEQAWIRLHHIGFVFQSFHLLPGYTAVENVALPLYYRGVRRKERHAIARSWLERVGLGERAHHRPNQLSGGQQQRVAIARACIGKPTLLLADEPTGALDTRTGNGVLQLLRELHEEHRLTIVLVTHDPEVAAFAARHVFLRDGVIEGNHLQHPHHAHPN